MSNLYALNDYLEVYELCDPLELDDLFVNHVQVHDDVVVVYKRTFRLLLKRRRL